MSRIGLLVVFFVMFPGCREKKRPPAARQSASGSKQAKAPAPSTPSPAVAPSPAGKPPATPRRPVTDTYHGVKVVDPYRWMEKVKAPEVKRWVLAQNRYSAAVLAAVPARKHLRERIAKNYRSLPVTYFGLKYRPGRWFALKAQPPKNQPMLMTLSSPDDAASERVLLDPNRLDAKGTTAIDFYAPSLDGKLVAVSLSRRGSEEGTVYLYDVATGRKLGDRIPRVNGPTAGGSIAWRAGGKSFFYTRYPRGKERPKKDRDFYQQVFLHKLGTPTSADVYAIGRQFPRIAEVTLKTNKKGDWVLAHVKKGDGGDVMHHLLGPSGGWRRLTHYADKVVNEKFGPDGALYLLSLKNAPRGQILRVPLAAPRLERGRIVVPQGRLPIEGFAATADRLYVAYMAGGPSELRSFDLDGRPRERVPLPVASGVSQMVGTAERDLLFQRTSYVEPPSWYRYDPASGKIRRTALYAKSPVDFSDVEVVRELATSKDGTRVPLNILRRKGVRLDGGNPVVLTGYGGYRINLSPRFAIRWKLWLEQGGVVAIANLRGGAEFGEEWHQGGMLLNKQNVFDDFIGCAKHLIARGYTTPARLAIEGGSNGGLLVAAAMTQRPDLFRAVVGHAGVYDMLRFEQIPNGVFIATEYGSVKNAKQFKAMYAYSPYHRVKNGTRYPAVLLLVGASDGRVNPAESWKFAARLQAASASPRPVLVQTSFGTGHAGTSLSKWIDLDTAAHSFLFSQLGMKYRPKR